MDEMMMDEAPMADGDFSPEEQEATLEFLMSLLQDAAMKHSKSLGDKYAPPPAEPAAPEAPVEGEMPVDGEPTPEELEAILAGG